MSPSIYFVICILSIQKFTEWFVIIPDYDICTLEIVIPLSDSVENSIGLLFSHAPFPLGFPKRYEIRRQLEILNHHVLVTVELCRHHPMHQYKLYILLLGFGQHRISHCMMDSFSFLEGFMMCWSPFKFHLLLGEEGQWLYYFGKIPAKISYSIQLVQGRYKLVWELSMGTFFEWLVSLKVVGRCPWCLKYVLDIEFLWK